MLNNKSPSSTRSIINNNYEIFHHTYSSDKTNTLYNK